MKNNYSKEENEILEKILKVVPLLEWNYEEKILLDNSDFSMLVFEAIMDEFKIVIIDREYSILWKHLYNKIVSIKHNKIEDFLYYFSVHYYEDGGTSEKGLINKICNIINKKFEKKINKEKLKEGFKKQLDNILSKENK